MTTHEAAFFRRHYPRKPRLPGTITPRRPRGTPAGQPIDWTASAARHAAYVADLVATFCPHEPRCERFTRDQCPERYGAANRAINARYATRNPAAKMVQPGRPFHWDLGDIRVIDRESPEGQEILARRAAATTVDPVMAALLRGMA